MSVEATRTTASLLALEYLVGQLLRTLPPEQQARMLEEARKHFTGHHPDHDSEALVVVYSAFGKPGGWRQG